MERYFGMNVDNEEGMILPDLLQCDLLILSNILFFFRFDELVILYNKFMGYIERVQRVTKRRLNCPIRECIERQLRTKQLSFYLEDYGPITPMTLFDNVRHWVNIAILVSVDLTALFDIKYFGCPMANFCYDFRAANQLKHLAISGTLVQNVRVRTHNLISLKLTGIPNDYADRHRRLVVLDPTGVTKLFRNVPMLRRLVIDYIPHFGPFQLSDCLESITIESYEVDTHTMKEFLTLHRFSLNRIRIFEHCAYVRNVFESLNAENVVFPNVVNLVFKTSDFLYVKRGECPNMPIMPWMFPKLKYLTFGLDMTEMNGESKLRETAELIKHYSNIGLKQVVLRKCRDFEPNEEFYTMLEWLNSFDGPNYKYVPTNVFDDYDDRERL